MTSTGGVASMSARSGTSDDISDEEDRKPAATIGTVRPREVNHGLVRELEYLLRLAKDGRIVREDEVVGHFLPG
jgi:hypothetical protein